MTAESKTKPMGMPDQFAVLKAEADGEPYRVEIPTKGKFVFPHVNSVDVFELNDAIESATTDIDVVFNTLRTLDPKEFDRLRAAKINRPTLIALYIAWQEHCGLREGESPASSA